MALITGGMGGMGLVASYEYAMMGKERIIAVAKSGHMLPGDHEAMLLDVIQDMAQHYIIRADIADAGSWSDTLAFANNVGTTDGAPPGVQAQMQEMDSLDVITMLLSTLSSMLAERQPISSAKLERVLVFRANMAQGFAEEVERLKVQPCEAETHQRLLLFQERLGELTDAIQLLRKYGLVEERPGAADAGRRGAVPGQAAAAAPGPEARERPPTAQGAGSGGCPPGPSGDVLLEMMEQELAKQRSAEASARPQGGSRAARHASCLDADIDHVPGGRSRGAELGPGKEQGGTAAGTRADEALPGACEGCGVECAAGSSHCPGCQRKAERSVLGDAIRRAKAETERKAQREAESRVRRAEEERRAKEESERRAREEREREAQAEAERRAREENGRRARELAERRAREEAARSAREEAEREGAALRARAEAERRALDDFVCPQGHALQPFTTQAGFPCDLCDAESEDGAVMWSCRNANARGCRTCDFDICKKCCSARRRRALQALGETV
mmetsp:Transcript_83232/g.235752  ORF Transcript_83232/g.235752 Transcript_83232/m.235752 type:complete len:507 (-) Transcript_83232:105-1625(-)